MIITLVKKLKDFIDKFDMERFFPISGNEKLALRKHLGYPCEGKVFLCVGRSVKAKGIDIAIDAFAQLKNTQH